MSGFSDRIAVVPRGGAGVLVTDFVGPQGDPPAAQTAARVRWDADGLAIAFDCADADVAASPRPRDDPALRQDDHVEVLLELGHTHSAATRWARVLLSAAGGNHDERGPTAAWFDGGEPKSGRLEWNAQRLAPKVERTAAGWRAEIKLAWADLGASPLPGQVWGFNLRRTDQPQGACFCWAPLGERYLRLAEWGHLVFSAGSLSLSATARRVEEDHRVLAAKDAWPIGPEEVFEQLDLDRPGLEKVRQAWLAHDATAAARELLAYYRARESVQFPVDPRQRVASRGKCATENELKIANDAMKHIFAAGHAGTPPHDFGQDIAWIPKPGENGDWYAFLHRMPWWEPMGKAYWHTGDETFPREWADQFLDWKRKCPPTANGGYETPWSSLGVGIRAQSLCVWYHYFRDAESFTPELLLEYLAAVYAHAALLNPQATPHPNWRLMEAEGLAFIGLTFPEFKRARVWRNLGIHCLDEELDAQVLPDGMQQELSFAYHGGCIEWFQRTAELVELNGQKMPNDYRARLERMYHLPAYCALPNGGTPRFGDSWGGGVLGLARRGAQLYRRPELAYIGSLGAKERQGVAPQETSVAFPPSGYYILRSDWTADAVCLALKCGPDGGWHAQPDNCSFELFAYGSYLMPDTGSYIYSGPDREFFRATAQHQCLTLDGQNNAAAGRLLLWRSAPDLTVLTVENRSYPDLAHRRTVFFVQRRMFVIVDEAIGNAPGKRRLHFQFGPPEAVLAPDGVVTVKGRGAGNLLFKPFLEGFQAEPEEGWVAFQYLKKEPRSAFGYELGDRAVFGSLLLPYQGVEPPACEARLLPGAGGAEFRTGDPVLELEFTLDGATISLRRDLEEYSPAKRNGGHEQRRC